MSVEAMAAKAAVGVAMEAFNIFWHGMKPKFGKDGKEIIDIILENSNEIPINILMVGGRRCGKTTVLSAIYEKANDFFGNGSLVINTPSISQTQKLTKKLADIKSYFESGEQLFSPDDSPTQDWEQYTFDVKIKNKKGNLALNFIDVNGEWFAKGEYQEKIKDLIQTSNILIVAIDTPHLMEENGKYNEGKNYTFLINSFIKDKVEFDVDKKGNTKRKRMGLFVPLKCEKYKSEGRMDEVKNAVKKEYKQSFAYLGGENATHCVVAITPIFTMGGVQFSQFEFDENNEIKTIPSFSADFPIPEKAIYRKKDIMQKEPNFDYCEQILLYVIVFMLENARAKKDSNSWFRNLLDLFFNMPSAQDFLDQKDALKADIKRNGDGYEIVNNPMGI